MKLKNYFQAWAKWLAYDPWELPQIAPRVVVIGGGSGIAKLLDGLKEHTYNLSAIVTVYDSGGSTGKLRQAFHIPAIGDLRNCILALAEKEDLLREVFNYRFDRGGGLEGHSVGNLFLTALLKKSKNLDEAAAVASKILKIKGRVYPASLDNASLLAELSNGTTVRGEARITEVAAETNQKIKEVKLVPKQLANKNALKAIRQADLIIIGPGSLFTSLVPNFLIEGIKKEVNQSKAPKIYVVNVSQERGETMGMKVEDHLDILLNLGLKLDVALVNKKVLRHAEDVSRLGEVENITTKKQKYRGIKILRRNIISLKNPLHHSSQKLARTIAREFLQKKI
ncbi:MAG: YvcK family protein [Patescibacteria group bacterium]|nr:YvcK family protein [Patescibacteria group bacterium]